MWIRRFGVIIIIKNFQSGQFPLLIRQGLFIIVLSDIKQNQKDHSAKIWNIVNRNTESFTSVPE